MRKVFQTGDDSIFATGRVNWVVHGNGTVKDHLGQYYRYIKAGVLGYIILIKEGRVE